MLPSLLLITCINSSGNFVNFAFKYHQEHTIFFTTSLSKPPSFLVCLIVITPPNQYCQLIVVADLYSFPFLSGNKKLELSLVSVTVKVQQKVNLRLSLVKGVYKCVGRVKETERNDGMKPPRLPAEGSY